jgi:hypothetical protein
MRQINVQTIENTGMKYNKNSGKMLEKVMPCITRCGPLTTIRSPARIITAVLNNFTVQQNM